MISDSENIFICFEFIILEFPVCLSEFLCFTLRKKNYTEIEEESQRIAEFFFIEIKPQFLSKGNCGLKLSFY